MTSDEEIEKASKALIWALIDSELKAATGLVHGALISMNYNLGTTKVFRPNLPLEFNLDECYSAIMSIVEELAKERLLLPLSDKFNLNDLIEQRVIKAFNLNDYNRVDEAFSIRLKYLLSRLFYAFMNWHIKYD